MATPGSDYNKGSYKSGLLRINKPLPEQWTLVKDWHMERREPFESWRSLANSQITRMYREMEKSIDDHPKALLS